VEVKKRDLIGLVQEKIIKILDAKEKV